MKQDEHVAFIETSIFPINIVNEASTKEKGGGRPPHWGMVFWWARRPLAGARAIILGSLLPKEVNPRHFIKWIYPTIRFRDEGHPCKPKKKGEPSPPFCFEKPPHNVNPKLPKDIRERLEKIKFLDPFAGFGSIPLEAIRLGIGEVIAVEFLPTSYIFLKAVLEYPKKFSNIKTRITGKELKELNLEKVAKDLVKVKKITDQGIYEIPSLIYDVARWGKWITEKLKEDPDIRELYDDCIVYIGTWEIRCPNTLCGKYTPLMKTWWIIQGKNEKYHMKFKPEADGIDIEVVEGKVNEVPPPNIKAKPELVECILCGNRITYVDLKTGRIYSSKNEASDNVIRERLEFYPRYAIRNWNQKLEEYLNGRISLEHLKKSLARPRLLVKVKVIVSNKKRYLKVESCGKEDNDKLWRAVEKLKQVWNDPDIPTEPVPSYESRSIWVYPYGFDRWFKLFNPRQLLTMIKLVKLIREVGRKIEEEKLKEGWNREEAFKYVEVITTYLTLALCKYADYNSMMTRWRSDKAHFEGSLSIRGIAMMLGWSDSPPFAQFTGTWSRNLENLINGLAYLISATSNSSSNVRVLLDDAAMLNELKNTKFDVIVTDPPYRDNVPYTELSDFYYIWLKRALSEPVNNKLKPKFYADVVIYNTQWEVFAPKEISLNEGRAKYFKLRNAANYYTWLLSRAFRCMVNAIKNDGPIITYFAHSNPEAWIELIEAGWKRAGLQVTRALSIIAELEQRTTAHGKVALESNIIVVWRKRKENKITSIEEIKKEALNRAKEALEEAEKLGFRGLDLFLAVMTACLATFTSYEKIVKFAGELSSKDLVRESYKLTIETLVGGEISIKSPEALAYITIRRLFGRMEEWNWTLNSQDLITLGYGLYGTSEESQMKRLYEILERNRIIKPITEEKGKKKRSGRKIAKPKSFIFLSPKDASINSIREILSFRSLDIIELKVLSERGTKPLTTSIDVLHLLEYAVHQGSEYFKEMYSKLMLKYPTLTEEAINVAKALSRIKGDPEANLCKKILDNIMG